ncbi:MAG: hypothetical protein AAF845_03295 [Bacteroidota bacterium]
MRLLLLAALGLALAAPASAQTCTTSWAAADDGDWSEAANWTAGVPEAGDTACITEAGTYTVTLDQRQALAGLVVGGASGTQTLVLAETLRPLGEGTIGANGVVVIENSENCGSCDGLPEVTGTLTVEGTLVHRNGVGLLSEGGTVDVAPGGTLRVRTGINSTAMGQGAVDRRSRFIVRGTLLFDAEGQAPRSMSVRGAVDLAGGTLAVTDGRIDFQADGRWTGGAFDVPEGGYLWFRSGNGGTGVYEVSGTFTGTPAGQVQFSNGASLTAASGGATLAVGGAGVEVFPGSGQSTFVRSTGGVLTNTGLLTVLGNGLRVDAATLRNEGTLDIRTTLILQGNGEVVNTEAATLRLIDTGSMTGGDDGRLLNEGTVVSVLDARTSARGRIATRVDVDGGRFEAATADMQLQSGGTWRDPAFAVAEGRDLLLRNGSAGGVYEISGTMSGEPVGSLRLSVFARLAAAPGNATLDVGGTGLVSAAGSGQSVFITSAGGEMVNTGLFTVRGAHRVQAGVLRNEGTVRVETSLILEQGGVLRNAPEGTLEFVNAGSMPSGDRTGRLLNEGLILSSGTGRSTLGSALRSQPGSEVRALDGAAIQLDAPGSASVPAGVAVTGSGTINLPSRELFLEGAVSPGTEAAPLDTLRLSGWVALSEVAGRPRLVVDVADGASDLVETERGSGPSGSVRLAGTLVVRVADGYTPQPGDAFTVLRTTNTTNDILGDFDAVVAEGAPAGIAFVAERDVDNTEVIVRAVAVDAAGTFQVSADALLGGGARGLFLSGPGAGGVTAARLACTACLDPEAFGTIPASVTGADGLREVRVDLTSPRAYGLYDLVLERGARPDTTVAVTVRPFLSYISLVSGGDRGAGVRPVGNRYNWSALTVTNTSNTTDPGFMIGAVNREAPDQVAFALAPSNAFTGAPIFFESDDAADPEAGALVLGRVVPGRNARLSYGQRVAPADVLFPEQTRTGPDDDRLPFRGSLVFSGLVAHHLSFDRAVGLVVEALGGTGDATLDGYLADVEASDPGAVERSVGLALLVAPTYTEGSGLFYDRVIDRLGDVVAPPSGLDAASEAFATRLDEAAGRHLLDIHAAHDVDLTAAPGTVRQLLVDEFEALGGYGDGSDTARRRQLGGIGACVAGAFGGSGPPPPAAPPLPDGLFSPAHTGALGQAIGDFSDRTSSALTKAHEAVHAVQQRCKTPEDSAGDGGGGGERRAAASCTIPPEPPGGPPGGGGGGCGGPSAPADPNDKTIPASELTCEFGTVTVDGQEIPRCVRYFVPLAQAADPITYTVDFENLPLATAPAEIVTITDVLDGNLDPSTLEVLATSSDSTFSVTVEGQEVTFRFVGIDLPPNVTDPEGTGFVTFAVAPRAGLEAGTEIRNDASIVFDFNPPIETPEVVHEIRETADLGTALVAPEFSSSATIPFRAVAVNGQGDAASEAVVTVTAEAAIVSASASVGACAGEGTTTVTCEVGTLAAGDAVTVDLALDGSQTGEYAVSSSVTSEAFDGFAANDTDLAAIGVTGVSTEDNVEGLREVTLAHPMPNPARGPVTLRWGLPEAGTAQLRVFDLLGREVAELSPEADAASGWHATTWAPPLASGVYVVRLDAEVGGRTEVRTRRMVVVR